MLQKRSEICTSVLEIAKAGCGRYRQIKTINHIMCTRIEGKRLSRDSSRNRYTAIKRFIYIFNDTAFILRKTRTESGINEGLKVLIEREKPL